MLVPFLGWDRLGFHGCGGWIGFYTGMWIATMGAVDKGISIKVIIRDGAGQQAP